MKSGSRYKQYSRDEIWGHSRGNGWLHKQLPLNMCFLLCFQHSRHTGGRGMGKLQEVSKTMSILYLIIYITNRHHSLKRFFAHFDSLLCTPLGLYMWFFLPGDCLKMKCGSEGMGHLYLIYGFNSRFITIQFHFRNWITMPIACFIITFQNNPCSKEGRRQIVLILRLQYLFLVVPS